jgi:hypothetical protein
VGTSARWSPSRAICWSSRKKLVEDSPPLKDGVLDRHAVAAHYGLAQG